MEDLDEKIDFMWRKKLMSVIQENSVRVIKINIRFTKNNQKNTLERLGALCDSYEKLLRDLLRQLIQIEKEIRKKYVVRIDTVRKRSLLNRLNTEIDIILKKMSKELRADYAMHRAEASFDERLEKIGASARESLEKQLDKLEETLNIEVLTSTTLSPIELSRFYELDESALIDLKAIKPLQKIHSFFNTNKGDVELEKIFEAINQSIRACVKIGESPDQVKFSAPTHDGRRLQKIKVIAETFLLKDFIFNLDILIDQIISPREKRNMDVIQKTWARLEELFRGNQEKEMVLSHLKLLNDTLMV